MQVFGLPRQVTRSAAAVSCLATTESSEAAHRREILARWQQARDDGLTADQASRAVPRSTLYRWQKSPEPRSRRPRRVRQPDWSPELVAAVREIRTDFPLWGKARITVLLHRRGHRVSESTAFSGNSWNRAPSPRLRRRAPRALRRTRPHAKRLPKGLKPTVPGEIVQLDTVTINPGPGRPTVKQFTACDPVAKWTCAQACRRATAHNAKLFLDKIEADRPVPIQAIQGDRSSRPTSRPRAGTGTSSCGNCLPNRPNSTDMSNATTAPGGPSSMPPGTCLTILRTSTHGSMPSPTNSTPFDPTKPLVE